MLQVPLSLCSTTNRIFVGDIDKQEILIFDNKYNHLKSFKNDLIKSPNYMTYDTEMNLLYVTDWDNNLLASFNYSNDNNLVLNNHVTIDSPMHIKLNHQYLLVISAIQYDKIANENKLDKITHGSNCIFKLSKNSFKMMQTIKLDDWLNPQGLMIDDSGNILTTALRIDLNNDLRISDNRYLFLLSAHGYLLKQFELNIFNVYDFVIHDNNKLISCFKNEISIHEFA